MEKNAVWRITVKSLFSCQSW